MNRFLRSASRSIARTATVASLTVVACLGGAGATHAQTAVTWTGTSNAAWGTGSNWSSSAVPGSTSDATFNTAVNANLNVSGTVNKLVFNGTSSIAGATSAALASGTLTIMGGVSHSVNNASTFTRIPRIILGADQEWNLTGGGIGSPTVGTGLTIASVSPTLATFDLNGKTLTKTGTGQLSMGGLTFGNGSFAVNAGSLRLSGGNNQAITGTGSGNITVASGAALFLGSNSSNGTGSITLSKAIVLSGGVDSANVALLNYGNGSLDVTASNTISAPIQWTGFSEFRTLIAATGTATTSNWTFSGNWSGAGTVLLTNSSSGESATKTSSTFLTGSNGGLTGLVDNQYSRADRLFVFNAANAGSANAEWRLSNANASYRLNNFSVSLGALSGTAGTLGNYGTTTSATATIGDKGIDSTFSGLIIDGSTSPLAVVKTGTGTLTLNGTSSYTGGTTVSAGALRGTTSGVQGAITNNAAVEFLQATTGTYAGIMGGSGSLTKSGVGSVTLSGANTFSGLTDVQAGTLAYGVNNALGGGNVQVSGGTLNIATFTDSVGTVTLTGGSIVGTTGVLSGTAYDVRSGSISAILNGTGVALTKSTSGTVTLSGSNTYSGQTRVSAGVLALGVSGAISNQSNLLVDGGGFNLAGFNDTVGTVTITSGSIFGSGTLTGSSYDIQGGAVTAILGGSGGLTKSTSGTTVLSGINAYTGVTAVNAGTLAVNGSIAASSGVGVSSGATLGGSGAVSIISGEGLVSPGNSPGILTATSIDPSTGMDFAFELTGTGSPTYGNASNSVNDVLRLTAATPALSALNTNNVVSVYFGGSIAEGDTFRGGTYVDSATTLGARDAFATAIAGADWQYYVYGNGGGSHSFNGTSYYTLGEYNSSLTITRTVVADSANFSGGTVNGAVTQFVVVPEPGALAIALTGIGGFMAWAARQRSRRVA